MKITSDWLKEKGACGDGFKWYLDLLQGKELEDYKFIQALLDDEHYDWAYWTFEQIFTKSQAVEFAIFAAELSLESCDKHNTNICIARKAIEAAKEVLKNDTPENRAMAKIVAQDSWTKAMRSDEINAWTTRAMRVAARAAWASEEDLEVSIRLAMGAASDLNEGNMKTMRTKIIKHGIDILARDSQ